MSVKDVDHGRIRIVCTSAKESGVCAVRTPFYLDTIERAVIDGLRNRLTDRGAIELYLKVYNEERQRLASEASRNRTQVECRLTSVEGELKRVVDLVVRGIIEDQDAKERLAKLKQERAELAATLEGIAAASKIVALHPASVAQYLRQVEELDKTINRGSQEGSESSKNALRDLIEAVVVTRHKAGNVDVEVRSRLARLVGGHLFPEFRLDGVPNELAAPSRKKGASRRISNSQGGSMVAEEGLEPPTQGL